MTTIRGIIFDVDGTLVDSNDAHAHAWVEAMAEHGYDASFDQVRSLIGMGSDKMLPEVTGVEKDTPAGKQMSESWKKIFEARYIDHLQAFPDVRPLLERMHADKLRLVVASSAEKSLLSSLLDVAGVSDLIEEQTSSDDAKNSKPDPDIVQAALDGLGYHGDETIMIGDTPYDVESAGKAGVPVIALRCGGWDDKGLAGALAIYDDPADLLAHYDQSPLGRKAT